MCCKLCQQNKALCQSDIIPESAYGPLYDSKHRFFEFGNTQKKLRPLQKGLREPLLCKECEQRLNKYDRYFADVWYRDGLGPRYLRQDLLTVKGIDYHRFKLFHMSVLWRAGVASRDEFREENLAEHEENLRNLILADNAGHPNEYAFFSYVLVSPKKNHVYQSLVTQPVAVELYDVPGFHVVFGGCVWHHLLSNNLDFELFPFIFQNPGTLYLLRVPIDQYSPVIDLIRERLKKDWRVRESK